MTDVAIKVGDVLWCNDTRSHLDPWFKKEIVGENKQSWLVGNPRFPTKVLKRTMLENQGQYGHCRWYTTATMREKRYVDLNRHKIAGLVGACTDVETLRRVAILMGHVDIEPENA